MRAPPWADPERYLLNSPLMQAGRISTPLLIAVGEIDGSHLGQAEELFSALFRQDRDALLLTYWGEPHLFGSPGNVRDLYRRGLAFLDAHLAWTPPSP
jgi:dipeptidyl aminopeptidase/acylaminoacyl peptidase